MRSSDEALTYLLDRVIEFIPYCLLDGLLEADDGYLEFMIEDLWEEFIY